MKNKLFKKKKKTTFSIKEKISITHNAQEYDSHTSQCLLNIIASINLTNSKHLPFWLKFDLQRRYNIATAIYLESLNEKEHLLSQLKEAENLMNKEFESFINNNNNVEDKHEKLQNPFASKGFGAYKIGLENNNKGKNQLSKWWELGKKDLENRMNQLKEKVLKIEDKARVNISSCLSTQIYHGAIFYTSNIQKISKNDVIIAKNVSKKIKTKKGVIQILKDINIHIKKGEMLAITGDSGSGKTILLNILSGLDSATKGDVLFNNVNLTYLTDQQKMKFRQKHVAMVFQENNLLANISALSNARIGTIFARTKVKKKHIYKMFELLGLKGMEKKKPPTLSGGQQQRVAIARALLKRPDILFCDEPTAALDKEVGQEIMDLLKKIQEKYGTTIVLVTHHPNVARQATRIVGLKDGKIIKSDITSILESNVTPFNELVNKDYKKSNFHDIVWNSESGILDNSYDIGIMNNIIIRNNENVEEKDYEWN